MKGWLAVLVACAIAACGHAASAPPTAPHLDAAQLHDQGAIGVDALPALLRAPTGDFREEITLTVRDDVAGRGFSGRGVVAVRPKRALRMILLGPGGTTAMDAWIAGARWRVSIPALDRVFRGDEKTREMPRGMPIPLLRSWLVDPFGGVIEAAHRGCVRDDGSIGPCAREGFVVFTRRDDTFEARERKGALDGATGEIDARAWWSRGGRVVAWLQGVEQRVGEAIAPKSAHYVSTDPPMTVDVSVGDATLAPLPDATFDDPDSVQ